MDAKQPGFIGMLIGLATLGWIAFAWDAYMQMSAYGSVLALCAGIAFIYSAREAAQDKNAPWLFGWNDEPGTLLLRLPAYASLFVGPGSKRISQLIAPDYFDGGKSYIAVAVVSIVVAFAAWLFLTPTFKR